MNRHQYSDIGVNTIEPTNLADALDWWSERSAGHRYFAEDSYRMAAEHRANLALTEPDGSAKLKKADFVVEEAKNKHIAEQRYDPKRQPRPRSKHHVYWLSAVGLMTITVAVVTAISLALPLAPFSSPLVLFVMRLLAPFIIVGLLIAIVVTAIAHYARKWS